jgi:hypothetical protein
LVVTHIATTWHLTVNSNTTWHLTGNSNTTWHLTGNSNATWHLTGNSNTTWHLTGNIISQTITRNESLRKRFAKMMIAHKIEAPTPHAGSNWPVWLTA